MMEDKRTYYCVAVNLLSTDDMRTVWLRFEK